MTPPPHLHLDEAFASKFICHSHRRDPNAEDKTLITGSQGPKWQLRKTAEPSGDVIEAVALCVDFTHFLAFEEDKQLWYTVKSAQTPEHNTLTLMYQNIKNTQKWNQYCWLFWQVSSQFLKSVSWLQEEMALCKDTGDFNKGQILKSWKPKIRP